MPNIAVVSVKTLFLNGQGAIPAENNRILSKFRTLGLPQINTIWAQSL